jgi:undecaprenyl-diphosphatase
MSDAVTLLQAAFLGLIEGLTEFIPVSSTGHLILLVDLLGFRGPPGQVFEIVIQLGAILAILTMYSPMLLDITRRAPFDAGARRFILAVLLGFLPAAVIGALAHDFIKSVLFSPWVVSVALILGGVAILLIERVRPVPVYRDIEAFSPGLSLGIGAFQVLAMIPGVSRSGATIMGALLLGVERKTATLFSFFLAIPTMLGATAYDLFKNRHTLDFGGAEVIAVGFVVAFLSALLVVRWLVGFVGRHGFGPFAWYRIALGTVMLGILLSR